MSSAHTPGPWSAPRGSVGIFAADGRLIATMDAPNNIPENFAANAHLIASAPELLDALKAAKFRLFGAGPSTQPLYAQISAAIAKAEGK